MNKKTDINLNPSRWPLRILRVLIKKEYLEEIEGDLQERFYDYLEDYSQSKARRLYVIDVFNLFRPILIRKVKTKFKLSNNLMIKNNLLIAWRQLKMQKVFSSIKVGGFAASIAACILIALYIGDQLNYDKHYKNQDRIFRLVNQWSQDGETGYWTNVQGPLKEMLEDNIPEFEKVARIVLWSWGNAGENHISKVNSENIQYESHFIYADPELLSILEVPMVYGGQEEALVQPNSMVISKTKADIYFPNENPVGRQMLLNNNPETTYTIGGVMEDFPKNSHLQADFILTLFDRKTGPGTTGWCCTNYDMYVKLTPKANKLEVEEKTIALRNSFVLSELEKEGKTGLEDIEKYQSYYLQPVANIYLNPEEVGDFLSHGSLETVRIFVAIGIIILLLASINFINLSTAKSIKRAKEVGLRKVVGSYRSNLVFQFLVESFLYCLLAIIIALFLAYLILPYFNQLAGTNLTIPWSSTWFLPVTLAMAIIVGFFSGIYPALYLSGFKPIEVLKGNAKGAKITTLRSSMVVFQFSAVIILIIGALVTHQQFNFFMNKSLGYEKERVVNIMGLDTMDESKRLTLKNELLKVSAIQNATLSDFFPVEGSNVHNRDYWVSERRLLDNGLEAARWAVDEDYIATMGMQIIQGRNFDDEYLDDKSLIINEQMVQNLHLENPIGVELIDMFDEKYTIVGVVKDFYFESLVGEVRPLVMIYTKQASTLSVKINSLDINSGLEEISTKWAEFNPNQAMRYNFMDQKFERMYSFMSRSKDVFLIFAIISILIACLGLFALSIHNIEQRKKEISVRKVLGASVSRIFSNLTFDFLKLIVISIVIAIPLGWYFMNQLLQHIANRIEISWPTFIVAGIMAIIIVLGTIGFETLRAALANPSRNLRNE